MKRAIQIVCAAVVVAAVILPARAITRTWVDNSVPGSWHSHLKWSPEGTPSPGDDLRVFTGSPTATASIKTDAGGSILINGVSVSSSEGVIVGIYGAGDVRVEAGGDISCRFATVGSSNGSVGVTEIDGPGSTWEIVQQLRVGSSGDGTLKITGGGVVTCDGTGVLAVGEDSYGRLLVEGSGSAWNVDGGYLSVGYRGGAEMTVRNGGAVYSAQGIVGSWSMSDATAIIEGDGSKWECSSGLFVGSSGTGALTVRDGGRLVSSWGLIANTVGSEGRITLKGHASRWDSNETVFVGGGVYGAGGEGRLEVNPSTAVTIRKDLVVYPGGTVAIGLNGSADGEYGQILAGDIATFGGTLEIHVAAGAALTPGESMDIITYSGTSTAFNDVQIFGAAPGSFEWTYGEKALELTYVPEPATLSLLVLGGLAVLRRRRRRLHLTASVFA